MPGKPLKCPSCDTTVTTYRNPFPTVDIIIRQGDRIVLIERKNEPKGWALPGGFVDYGESLEHAARREAEEETGLELKALRQFGAYSEPNRDPRQHNISFVFTAEGDGHLRGGDDAARARFFELNDLPESLCFDHDRILSDYRDATADNTPPPAVSFIAESGTGKTSLLEKVVGSLKGRGYRIGVIKHDAHRFDIDHPGKDSYRLTAAGADTMLIASEEKLAVVKQQSSSPRVEDLIATYFGDVDIVLTEGFKKNELPKIEVNRKERGTALISRGEEPDPTLLAVASDQELQLDVPVLDINSPEQVADFIEQQFLGRSDHPGCSRR
ncbi:MAG: molybdopterin-guanine dinucleotide biosynthesis protein B [Desulfuromonadales bacterium]